MAEVLLALVFTAFVVLAVVGAGLFAGKARGKSELHSQASWLATSLIHRCLEQLEGDFEAEVAVPEGTPVGPPLDSTGRFVYGVEESFIHPPEADDLKRIRVTVRWTDAQGEQTYQLSTKVSR